MKDNLSKVASSQREIFSAALKKQFIEEKHRNLAVYRFKCLKFLNIFPLEIF